ncbi:MAG: hypothetical protein PVTTEEND_000681 [Candidatus Fervidibacter sp.]
MMMERIERELEGLKGEVNALKMAVQEERVGREQMVARLNALEQRLARLEGQVAALRQELQGQIAALEQELRREVERLWQELTALRTELTAFKAAIEERFKAVEERFRAIEERFKAVEERLRAIEGWLRTLVLLILTTWLSTLAAIITLFFRGG